VRGADVDGQPVVRAVQESVGAAASAASTTSSQESAVIAAATPAAMTCAQ